MNTDDSESIYRSPSSNTSFEPKDDLLTAYVGPKNTEYYLRHFERFGSQNGSVSWNWPAFFVSAFWLLYRKMWLNAFLYWIVLPIVLIVISIVVTVTVGDVAGGIFYYAAYFVIAFILVPMFANWLYYRHAQSKISKVATATSSAGQHAAELARIGGTSKIVLVILPIFLIAIVGIMAAISIPAYQDYTIRAQVAEGLSLSGAAKVAVAQEFANSGALPYDNASAGLPDPESLSGTYVASIAIADGTIIVTYGNQAHDAIFDGELLLQPVLADDGTVSWTCESSSIEPKHLPASCR